MAGAAGTVSKRFLVVGRVQGVGFRYFVVREAEALGVSGWVRNLPDGNVEVLASAEPALVDVFEGRLWHGPPHARIKTITASTGEAPATPGFRVLPTPW
jgi:acylphosphatase